MISMSWRLGQNSGHLLPRHMLTRPRIEVRYHTRQHARSANDPPSSPGFVYPTLIHSSPPFNSRSRTSPTNPRPRAATPRTSSARGRKLRTCRSAQRSSPNSWLPGLWRHFLPQLLWTGRDHLPRLLQLVGPVSREIARRPGLERLNLGAMPLSWQENPATLKGEYYEHPDGLVLQRRARHSRVRTAPGFARRVISARRAAKGTVDRSGVTDGVTERVSVSGVTCGVTGGATGRITLGPSNSTHLAHVCLLCLE